MDNIFIKVGGKSIELKLAGININAKNPADLFAQPAGYFNFAAKCLLYRASGI